MGLPVPPSFPAITPVAPSPPTPRPARPKFRPTGPDPRLDYYGWTDETSLDVEWSHAMAPEANILLVETPVTETEGIYGFPQIVAAENYVIDHHLASRDYPELRRQRVDLHQPRPDLLAALRVRQRRAAWGDRPGGQRRPGLDRR